MKSGAWMWDYCHSAVTPIYTAEIANAARWKEDERCDELFTTLKWPVSAGEPVMYSMCHWSTRVMALRLRRCQYERQVNDLSTGCTQQYCRTDWNLNTQQITHSGKSQGRSFRETRWAFGGSVFWGELSRLLAVSLGGGVGIFLHGFLVCPQTNWVC